LSLPREIFKHESGRSVVPHRLRCVVWKKRFDTIAAMM
jgi:hypothetical protein